MQFDLLFYLQFNINTFHSFCYLTEWLKAWRKPKYIYAEANLILLNMYNTACLTMHAYIIYVSCICIYI